MGSYHNIGIVPMSFTAGEDLSASKYRYRMVQLGNGTTAASEGKVYIATGGSLPAPIGVLQNSPCSGEEAQVCVLGNTKLCVNAACIIGIGMHLVSDASAHGYAQAVAGSPYQAISFEYVASGSAIIEALWLPNLGLAAS